MLGNVVQNAWYVIKLSRPLNGFIAFCVVHVVWLMVSKGELYHHNVLLGALAVVLVGSAANVINDILDIEIDKINRPARILPSGKMSPQMAFKVYFSFLALAVLCGLVIETYLLPLFLIIFSIVILHIYSVYLKKQPIIGNIVVAGILGLSFIFAGSLLGHWDAGIWPGITAFCFMMGREIVKDIQDIPGDSKLNAMTLPIRFGVSIAKFTSLFFLLFGVVFSILSYFVMSYSEIYLYIILLAVCIPTLLVCVELITSKQSNEFGKISTHIKWIIFPYLIALILNTYL